MRALLPPILLCVALAGCAGSPADSADPDAARGGSAEMEELEPAGPFDATLENEPGEFE